jgi:LysM repeat protein
MKTQSALRPFFAISLVMAVLSGCSLLGDGPKWGAKKAAPKEFVVPSLPEPVPTHRFEIDATTDIVGVVQKTIATKDDTLTDIARRFNVGYEEIVRANPGVDPWLPGENREIVIPSQFVLPNAPREGVLALPCWLARRGLSTQPVDTGASALPCRVVCRADRRGSPPVGSRRSVP